MGRAEVAGHLLSSCPALVDYQAYMFGSSLHGIGEDFDILIVGPGGEALARLKSQIAQAGSELPLHVLYMLPSEGEETGFVAKEGCVPLSDLAVRLGGEYVGR
ncbi:UNVERIFIED_ORG: hypothetical protein GGD47_002831 [Rhizobium etli]